MKNSKYVEENLVLKKKLVESLAPILKRVPGIEKTIDGALEGLIESTGLKPTAETYMAMTEGIKLYKNFVNKGGEETAVLMTSYLIKLELQARKIKV